MGDVDLPDGGGPPPTNWRSLFILVGVVVGLVVVAAVVGHVGGGDDSSTTTSTTTTTASPTVAAPTTAPGSNFEPASGPKSRVVDLRLPGGSKLLGSAPGFELWSGGLYPQMLPLGLPLSGVPYCTLLVGNRGSLHRYYWTNATETIRITEDDDEVRITRGPRGDFTDPDDVFAFKSC